MKRDSGITIQPGAAAAASIALLLAGAAGTYLLLHGKEGGSAVPGADQPAMATPRPFPAGSENGATPSPPAAAVVSLSKDAINRAGIVIAPVGAGTSTATLRLPGVVEPNAYRQVRVTSLVTGRVVRVMADLGAAVRRGQTLAEVYSPQLAEAQTKYASARAMLDAHDRELQRTHKLVDIGAASRQELERIHAEHAAQSAEVESASAQLELLGLDASAIAALGSNPKIDATTSIPAPIDGVVTERTANAGLNVDPSTVLLTVLDLSTVWVMADVYERDFAAVRVGSGAMITTPAYPGLTLHGRVGYIDPQVDKDSRTARARIELANPRHELRLGMFVDITIAGERPVSRPVIPRRAVQNVGSRTILYVARPAEPGTFTEREVRLGAVSGDQVEVLAGVQPGDSVVTEGSFFVRAELERLTSQAAGAAPTQNPASAQVQAARVIVTGNGFEPSRLSLKAGIPAQITFLRTTDQTCATAVVIPELNLKRELPLNQPVTVVITPKTGEMAFACGMNMFHGTIVSQ